MTSVFEFLTGILVILASGENSNSDRIYNLVCKINPSNSLIYPCESGKLS